MPTYVCIASSTGFYISSWVTLSFIGTKKFRIWHLIHAHEWWCTFALLTFFVAWCSSWFSELCWFPHNLPWWFTFCACFPWCNSGIYTSFLWIHSAHILSITRTSISTNLTCYSRFSCIVTAWSTRTRHLWLYQSFLHPLWNEFGDWDCVARGHHSNKDRDKCCFHEVWYLFKFASLQFNLR